MNKKSPPWYRRIGPSLITACVVIGPGSILTSSKVGATNGYTMIWVVLAAAFFMLTYMWLGARLGAVTHQSPCDLVRQTAGRPLAIALGCGVFFISAAFQFGNNLGVHSAFSEYIDFDYAIVLFNALTIAFLFAFRNLYQTVERLMALFVAVMLGSFALNLAFARPDIPAMLGGVIPRPGAIDLSVLGLIGTTFVVTAAFFQAYLVRQKGWDAKDLQTGFVDVRIGTVVMALITIMLMATAAAVLQGRTLGSLGDVAASLEPLFGPSGKALFCLGVFAAAYSSFLVNSMIGGFVLADGLGLGSKPTDFWPRILTTVVLLTGMGVALLVIRAKMQPVPLIIAAQAVTVIASPLIAGVLLWLTNRRDLMAEHRNGPAINVAATLGFVLILGMAGYTAFQKLPDGWRRWQQSQQVEEQQAPVPKSE